MVRVIGRSDLESLNLWLIYLESICILMCGVQHITTTSITSNYNRSPKTINGLSTVKDRQYEHSTGNVAAFRSRSVPRSNYDYSDISTLADIHNNFRRNVTPPASDMNYVTWSDELASLADRWAKSCKWDHGHSTEWRNGSRQAPLPFGGSVAQNIWKSSNADPSTAVWEWFNENHYYHYNTATCKPGKICGHYRIMAFGQLQEVGCGSALCPFGFFTVCNYGPSVPDAAAPYKIGSSCAQCQSGTGWCDHGLCRMCEEGWSNSTCKCDLKCQNCGVLDNTTCMCDCKAGWTNTDCSEPCVDSRGNCRLYDQSICDDAAKSQECPAFCNHCNMIDQNTSETELCCNGTMCPLGAVLAENCQCIAYAPLTSTGTLVGGSKWIISMITICFTLLE